MALFKEGSSGADVERIQELLKEKGFDPGFIDGEFGPGTEAAVMAFQKSEGLAEDGIVGLQTQKALGMVNPDTSDSFQIESVTTVKVSRMFPQTPIGNIKMNLPFVLDALKAVNLADKSMVLMALATIRAEVASFEPISEFNQGLIPRQTVILSTFRHIR